MACNRAVKLGRLDEVARGLGAEAVATGHYARVERSLHGRLRLRRAVDLRKDQTYVLHALAQEQLARACFPLAALTKDEVRREAARRGLPVASKPDSQELCFVPDGDLRGYLVRTPQGRGLPGAFVEASGAEVGRHEGAAGFTRGQRRGLPALGRPRYVTAVEPEAGLVRLGEREDLLDPGVEVNGLNWVDEPEPPPGSRYDVLVQVRHAQVPVPGALEVSGRGCARVLFAEPVYAAAPGQALVAYRADAVLCGGPIARVLPRVAGASSQP